MKVLLSWLNDYIETGLSAEQTAQILSDLGFPNEAIVHLDDDAVIDIEVTSNRGDCLGYIGIARELSAATGKPLKIPAVELDECDKDIGSLCSVEIAEPDLCGRYTARIIEDVKVASSPDWLKNRLEAIGMRSVNNVVDATNYAMIETGQPPHAFDYAKIKDGKIIVRRAVAGEQIVSIDGTRCKLEPDMLIIADPNGPVAIAGVMGGLDTEVSDRTTTILLEDACFDPVSVRSTSRKLTLPSEASFRFERIVDIEAVDRASKRTAQLIVQAAGGKAASGVVDVYPKKPQQNRPALRFDRLNLLLGIKIPVEEIIRILSALHFQPQRKGDSVICTVPSWRICDVYREVDLIEEVARVHGYDKVFTRKKIEIEVAPVDSRQRFSELVGKFLNGAGYYETISVSFTEEATASLFTIGDTHKKLAVKDESRKSANLLRQTLISSLLAVIKTNLNAGVQSPRVFEIANTFIPAGKTDQLPLEQTKLALACEDSFRRLSGVIEGLIHTVNSQANVTFEPARLAWAQPGANILVNGNLLGGAGVISNKVKEKFDFKNITPCAAELDFMKLLELEKTTIKSRPIPRFPAIDRDLSIIVPEQTAWKTIADAVNKKAPLELEKVSFVDIYHGKNIPAGKKSVTLSLRFRDADGTLTHETVDKFEAKIIDSLSQSVEAQLRTI